MFVNRHPLDVATSRIMLQYVNEKRKTGTRQAMTNSIPLCLGADFRPVVSARPVVLTLLGVVMFRWLTRQRLLRANLR